MKNKLIAITGGIGSGKSAVCKILKDFGYSVFSADEVYAELLNDLSFVKEIYNALNIENAPDFFDRNLVSKIVFNNKEKLNVLNKITHNKIMKNMLNLSQSIVAKDGVVFNEVPLLFESGFESVYDGVLVVVRDVNLRIQSIIERDNLTLDQAISRINSQFNYNNLNYSTYTIINNDADFDSLAKKCRVILNEIIKK